MGRATAPFIAVLDPQLLGQENVTSTSGAGSPVEESWTFPGQEGKPTRVDVYSADEEVELRVNGISAGRKPAGAAAQNKVSFEVTYQPGTIEAVSFTAGQESGRTHLQTTGQAARLHAERRPPRPTGCLRRPGLRDR